MALINNPALNPVQPDESKSQAASIYTANAIVNAPQKISNRPVEPVPVAHGSNDNGPASGSTGAAQPAKFDWGAAKEGVGYAQDLSAQGGVSGNSLVQNQLNTILSSDSPLLKRARTDGLNSSAEKGLNNTSMGVQAGEEAMIRQALPIAQQDASTYGNMDMANLNAKNQFGMAGLNQQFTEFNQKNQNDFAAGQNDLDRSQRNDLFDKGNVFTADQNNLDRTQRQDLFTEGNDFTAKNTEASDNRRIAADKDLASVNAKNTLALHDIQRQEQVADNQNNQVIGAQATYQAGVAQIMGNPSMTPSQASAAIKSLQGTTATTLKMIGAINNIDLSAYMPTGSVTGTSTTDKKGVVTNTFNYSDQSAPGGSTSNQSGSSKAGDDIVTAVNGSVRMRMTRTEANTRHLQIIG